MSRMRPSRDEIIERFRACAQKLGQTPGMARFCKTAGVSEADVSYYWPRMGDLAKEAGAIPNQFATAIPEDELFADYARVCLHLGKIPTSKELRIATRELGTRTHRLYHRFDSAGDLDTSFRAWLATAPEQFGSVLALPGWRRAGRTEPTAAPAPAFVFHPFLPAGLQYLDVLARGEFPPHHSGDESVNVAFERKCGDAFQALGFEVSRLGQGKGRAPDILATARSCRYGIIVDAKSRKGKEGYLVRTDDRAFHEYVTNYSLRLRQDGIGKAYLAVVGPSFRDADLKKLSDYLAGSEIRGITLFSASALMRLVEDSIRERSSFTLEGFEKTLFGNSVVSA